MIMKRWDKRSSLFLAKVGQKTKAKAKISSMEPGRKHAKRHRLKRPKGFFCFGGPFSNTFISKADEDGYLRHQEKCTRSNGLRGEKTSPIIPHFQLELHSNFSIGKSPLKFRIMGRAGKKTFYLALTKLTVSSPPSGES